MLKIFLVEDEVIVREGIKNNIDWEGNGFIFSGEASDGELALPLIKEKKPDIVITDIRMPFMDGLTLSRIIKEELPETQIIILSGYEEFEYAKEGIKIGVAEYLLKPITRAKLLEAIKKVAVKIESERESISLMDTNPKQFNRNEFLSFLRVGEENEVDTFVENILNNHNDALESKIFRQYFFMDAYFCIADFIESIGSDKKRIPDFSIEDIMMSKDYMKRELINLVLYSIAVRSEIAGNKYGDIVKAVLEYIELNYADEELSLNSIATHVNFSPNHLSMIFSQEKGEPLIKYITDYRIQKSKELLRCTNKKTNIIANDVGYKDSHYFSSLFKKYTGMTPTEYREIKK